MPSRFVKDMLRARSGGMRDGRNPYGSRGGYVTSRDPRRDRAMEEYRHDSRMRGDMRGEMRGDYNRMDYAHGMDYPHGGYEQPYDMRGMDYRYDDRRDYGEQYGKLSHEDMEEWKHNLQNADGTQGEHFKKEQIEPLVRQMGIEVDRMGGIDLFCLTVNMMYSDYCIVGRKFNFDRPEFYLDLAKAFLEDKDFHGTPEEKLYLYFKCIVDDD